MPSTVDDEKPPVLSLAVTDEAALAPLARQLVSAFPPKAFVTLEGDLGAGKTTFVKAVAKALGIDPSEVVSPTFGLIHVHQVPHALVFDAATGRDRPTTESPDRLVHADLYRLSGVGDLAEIGWEDATSGRCWVFVEWPQRIADALPADRLDIAISIDSETGRTFRLTPRGTFAMASW